MEEVLFPPGNDYVLGTFGPGDEDLFGSVVTLVLRPI
jgi:hypothetical protein